jgi:hypothetical protein
MSRNESMDDFVCLGLGLLFSTASSVLEHFGGGGSASTIASGALAGVSTVAFGTSILMLIGGVSLRRRGRKSGYVIRR